MTGFRRTAAMVVVVDFLLAVLLMQQAILALSSITHHRTPPSIPTYGKYAVIVQWKSGSHDDVDTYVEDPQDHIVSFVNPSLGLMHLEQDDLGTGYSNSTTVGNRRIKQKINQERVIITGIVPGEYTVNVHMFNKRDPGAANVTVKLVRLEGEDTTVVQKTVVLHRGGDEKTAFRFTLRQNGSMCCVNQLNKELVYANSAGVPMYSVPPSGPGYLH